MTDKPVGRTPIPEEKFRKAWLWLLEKHHPDHITATKLHKTAGGSYHRSVEMLDKFKQEYLQQNVSPVPIVETDNATQSPWLQESLDQLVGECKTLLARQFQDFSPLFEDKLLTASQKLDDDRLALEFAVKSKQDEIDQLHAELDGLSEQIASHAQIMKARDETVEKLQENLRQNKALTNRRENERDRAQESLKERQEALSTAERNFMDTKEERDTLRGKLSTLQTLFDQSISTHQIEVEKLTAAVESAGMENKQLNNDLGNANGQLKQLLTNQGREGEGVGKQKHQRQNN